LRSSTRATCACFASVGCLLADIVRRSPFPAQIFEASFGGVTEAIANLTADGAIDPLVKITVSLDESSFVTIDSAVAFGEIKDDSFAGAFKAPLLYLH